jgi:hypothetical protein
MIITLIIEQGLGIFPNPDIYNFAQKERVRPGVTRGNNPAIKVSDAIDKQGSSGYERDKIHTFKTITGFRNAPCKAIRNPLLVFS